MEKIVSVFLSLFISNVLTLSKKFDPPFPQLYWNFPCQNYLEVIYTNIRNGYEKLQELHIKKIMNLTGWFVRQSMLFEIIFRITKH